MYDDGDSDAAMPPAKVHRVAAAAAPGAAAAAAPPAQQSTSAVMDFLESSQENAQVGEMLASRKKLAVRIRACKARIAHSKMVALVVELARKFTAEWAQQLARGAAGLRKQMGTQRVQLASALREAATQLACAVQIVTVAVSGTLSKLMIWSTPHQASASL